MSDDRRRQQRAEQVRRRRQQRPMTTTAASDINDIEMPGVFGWMQRNGRLFVLVGILVMVGSVAGSFLLQSANTAKPNQWTATATPTIEPGKAVGTPGTDGVIRRYAAAPAVTIDPKKSYTAIIHTEKGDITAQLLADKAPIDTNNFVFLARNKFFDGLTFHRVVTGFVAQGGDPLGNGTGGPGYTLPVEKNDVQFDAGILSMASSSAGVSGSQFFITLAPQPQLEPQFSAFGRVTSGMEVVKALTARDPQGTTQPPADRILKIEIIEK